MNSDTGSKPTGPLRGVKVVDLTSVLMGPYCTQILGDLGADIVKIESPQGDTTRWLPIGKNAGMSGMFININRNKRGMVLNLKDPRGREILLKLVSTADVFIHSMRFQAMSRLGLDYETIKAINPSIVYANLYGYSRRGPRANGGAYDDTIQAISGMAKLQEKVIGKPNYVPTVIADKVTGLTAAYSVLAALFERQRSGEGQEIEIGMYETMVTFLMSEHIGGHMFDPPIGPPLYERAVSSFRRPYCTSDGAVAVNIYTDGHFRTFARLVGDEPWADDPRFAKLSDRWANLEEFSAQVEAHMSRKPSAYWMDAFEKAGLPFAPVQSLEELHKDPHLQAVGFFKPMETSEGTVRFPGIPSWFSRTPANIRESAPRLGEHSADILKELGFSDDSIETYMRDGVTKRPT
jgi:crotonobetainyl-CoA:carnitine CoA-transferase CaiB-like acyl-CoA transferase